MQLLDPTVAGPEHHTTRAPRLTALSDMRIGLLANGKVNADVLLAETAALFADRHGCHVQKMLFKGNASAPAGERKLAAVADTCDFMLTAMGD